MKKNKSKIPSDYAGDLKKAHNKIKTLDEEDNSSGWEDDESREEEPGGKDTTYSMSANKKIQELLSSPAKLKKHQEVTMKEAMSGLVDTEEFMSGIAEASMQAFQQNQGFLSDLMGLASHGVPTSSRKAGASFKVKSPSKSKVASQAQIPSIPDEHADWINGLVADTEGMMNDFAQNTNMQDFMSTLMGRDFNSNT